MNGVREGASALRMTTAQLARLQYGRARALAAFVAAVLVAGPLSPPHLARAQDAAPAGSDASPARGAKAATTEDEKKGETGAATPAASLPARAAADADPARTSGAPPGSSATAPQPPRRPIADSIDRSVAAVVRAHTDPCATPGSEGKPCFPIVVEEEGPSFSVKDGLRRYRPDGRPAPGVPTTAEIQSQMTGHPSSAAGGVGGDPVCGAKSLVRVFKGEPNTFFLYRLTKEGVERPLLTDHKVDVLTYTAAPGAQLEFMGEFSGECAAIAAWRKALRKAREPAPEPESDAPAGHRPQTP